MSAQHTPGPWTVEADVRTERNRSTGEDIEYVAGFNISAKSEEIVGVEGIIPSSTAEANARLIAAAPELFESLRSLANAPQSGWTIAQALARDIVARLEGDA